MAYPAFTFHPDLARVLLSGIALLLLLAWSSAASSQTPCERSADRAMQACNFGTLEDRRFDHANCLHIPDNVDRRDCNVLSREERQEDLETCMEQHDARLAACDLLGEVFYYPDPLLDESISFVDPDDIPDSVAPNPFLSLAAGRTWVIIAGEEGEETDVVHVTEDVREIQGVLCRVVVDAVAECEEDEESGEVECEGVEVTDDWYAQDTDGNVYYCGELSRNYEDGLLDNLDGSFEAGKEFAKAGVLLRAATEAGISDRQEFALGRAEDITEYISLSAIPTEDEGGDNESFPCAPGGCLQTHESNPLEPADTEFKYYIPGTGFVLAVAMEDGEFTGEREELTCIGDSLDVLEDEACGIEDLEALLDALCTLAPEAFCED